MNKVISDGLPRGFAVPMRWNIPVKNFGVVQDVYIMRPQVNTYLADYYAAIDMLIYRNNSKPLHKFTGDAITTSGQYFALITEPEIIWSLFEDEHTADLLSRPVYDVYHDEWVEVDDLFCDDPGLPVGWTEEELREALWDIEYIDNEEYGAAATWQQHD